MIKLNSRAYIITKANEYTEYSIKTKTTKNKKASKIDDVIRLTEGNSYSVPLAVALVFSEPEGYQAYMYGSFNFTATRINDKEDSCELLLPETELEKLIFTMNLSQNNKSNNLCPTL